MSKDKDKRLEEREKIEAEIARSLSVVKMKETHKLIEEVEKSRKRAAIQSIIERITHYIGLNDRIVESASNMKKAHPKYDYTNPITERDLVNFLKNVAAKYESIRLDLKRNLDVAKDDFEKLFPKMELDLKSIDSVAFNLTCLNTQLVDMIDYCKRLI